MFLRVLTFHVNILHRGWTNLSDVLLVRMAGDGGGTNEDFSQRY